jgi:hypothetical protein
MRKGMEKTVMAIRDSQAAQDPDRTGSTPDSVPGSADSPAITPEQRRALDELFSVTYEELRRLASVVSRGDPSATMNPTALVNEAWLKYRSHRIWRRVPGCISNASRLAPCGNYWWKPRAGEIRKNAAREK